MNDPGGKIRGETGHAVVIAIVFVMVFAVIGAALYWLVTSQTRSVDLERTEVKSFNVAEAGIDAGMLALKMNWPERSADQVVVDEGLLKSSLQATNPSLWDARRSDPNEFLEISVFDNSIDGVTVSIPPEDPNQRTYWDANLNPDGSYGDGKMYIEASSNVGDNRHRILVLAECHTWDIAFTPGLALWADTVSSNGQGLEVRIEKGDPPVYYDVQDVLKKGITAGPGVEPVAHFSSWGSVFPSSLQTALLAVAKSENTYFTSASSATAFLTSGNANGRIVYIESTSAVEIASNVQIGTEQEPVVVVIDTPDGTVNGWDLRGTADFYGVVVVLGHSILRGTSGIHGALYSQGQVENKGTGSSGEINYNAAVLNNIRAQYIMSVNIVPNTWEEYTTPRAAVAGP